MNTLGDLLEQSSSDLLVRGILREVDRDEELLGLFVNVTDVDTTLVGEKNPVALRRSVLAGDR